MTTLTLHNVDDQMKALLSLQAVRHGCTLEEEILEILRQSVEVQSTKVDFAQRISRRFAEMDVEDLPLPARGTARVSVMMKE